MTTAQLRTTSLGPEGLAVSALGFGCTSLSNAYGQVDEPDAIATLRQAVELGVTLFDTADSYGGGHNEDLIGRGFAGSGLRDGITLATKFGMETRPDGSRRINGRPEYVRAQCESSLRRLQTDHIDLYYQHRVDPTVPIEDTVGMMSELVAEGKVRHLGLSQASPTTMERAAAVHPITALQTEWSIWTRELEGDVLDTARRLGIGIVAFSPLGRGFLSGTVVSREGFDAADSRTHLPRFQEDNLRRNLETLERLQAIADRLDITLAQLSLAWVLARGQDVVPIPGTKRVSHLEQNLATLAISLDADTLAAIDECAPADAWVGARSSANLSQGFGDSPARS